MTANMRKSLRQGKVLIDWSQNHPAKTTVGAYSVRDDPGHGFDACHLEGGATLPTQRGPRHPGVLHR